MPQAGDPSLVLLRRVGRVDPTSLAAYRADGGFEALRTAFDLGPAGVLRELHESKLLGRGGAAFPAGRKWEAVARQPNHPHELVCNADESEPGTFKDRVLMEGDPFGVLEAVIVAGVTVGAEHGWIYLRGEYPLARQRLQHAIDECRAFGYLGDDVMGRGVRFDVEIFRGAGAYICGEETAIFNSIEGQRGEPRNKPPFPVDAGLFGHPTLVNNVETLVNVLPILLHGGATYAATGTDGSTGPKLFCLSGKVAVPGVYEVPFGTTLGQLLARAGGVAGGRPLQAVLLGGAAGGFAGPADLDVPLTFEDTRAAGLTLGSGVVMVLDDTVDLVPFLLRIAAFFRDESCGQCVPCRVGTVRQEEALLRLAASRDQSHGQSSGRSSGSPAGDLALLDDLARVMQDASICGLGQTAANAIQSAVSRLGGCSREGGPAQAPRRADRRRPGDPCHRGFHDPRRLPRASAPRSRRSATGPPSRRSTRAACAWWRSKGVASWCRRAPARSSRAWRCARTPSAPATPVAWCSSSWARRSTSRRRRTWRRGRRSTAPNPPASEPSGPRSPSP